MKVCIVGTGYVGLVTGAGLAARGQDVVCVDLDAQRVSILNAGGCPIFEPGLPDLLRAASGSSLTATTDLRRAVRQADLSMICVGTPFDGASIDLSHVRAAAEAIGEALRGGSRFHTVVVKSTVVPGTTEDLVRPLIEAASARRVGESLGLGMNPEFLAEGEAVANFMNPDRIIAGGVDARSIDAIVSLYQGFGDVPVVRTRPRTAEMIKYASNALFSTLISFSNEIANLCSDTGVDSVEVMDAVHLDRRLSPVGSDGHRVRPGVLAYLKGGCGFGGSCFGKDVRSLIAHGRAHGQPTPMLSATIETNEKQPSQMVALLRRRIPNLAGVPVTVLGLAFKPGTDDVRDSPALEVARQLVDERAVVTVFDPAARDQARTVLGTSVRYAASIGESLAGARAVMIMTAWEEFRRLPSMIAGSTPVPIVVDGRRMLSPDSVSAYEGIGWPLVVSGEESQLLTPRIDPPLNELS